MTFATTLTAAALASRVRKDPGDPDVARAWAAAIGLLTDACEDTYREIPPPVADVMALKVARAVWDGNRQPTSGAAQTAQVRGEGAPPVPRDPLAVVAPILSRYVLTGLA